MWLIVAIGAMLYPLLIIRLDASRLGLPFFLLSLVTIGVGSRICIKIPRFQCNVSISDVFVFLAMFLFGKEPAVLLGVVESSASSLRITKNPLTLAFNSAAMLCSTFVTAEALSFWFGPLTELAGDGHVTRLVIASGTMAILQFATNTGIIAVAGALRADKPIWQTWNKYYRWSSVSYIAAATAAAIIARLLAHMGVSALIAFVPVVAIVYFTYLTYVKNIEASMLQAEQAKRHLAELRESEERFHNAFDNAPIGMALVGLDGQWLQVNRSLCEIVGYQEAELLEMTFHKITHLDDLHSFLNHFHKVLKGESAICQAEKRYLHKLGHEVWVLVSVSPLHDSQKEAPHFIFQILDITGRRLAEQRLRQEALNDALTGLPNRTWFMNQLKEAFDNLKRNSEELFAVLFLDLDRFKIINDSIGHIVGDQLLIGIADRLRYCVRNPDAVARLGGDEFTILLKGINSPEDVIRVAERVQAELARPFNLGGYETFTTVSIGIAFPGSHHEKPDDLLRDADTAMYQAKSLGKARHVTFNEHMHTSAMNLMKLESDLRKAIERKEFLLHYQPIISLESARLTGFEALLRWFHPERGLIHPSEFIPVAEETGLIVPIGQWVLEEACSQMKRWHEQFPQSDSLSISVNLSSKQFAQPELIEHIIQALATSRLDPHSLKLEITESVVMENTQAANAMLERLRGLGVELSIDDFGTGYSSLSYLHRLPIDTLKIDRSFVGRITENNENKEIVRTIIHLAQGLGMSVIAEGVETKAQLESLRELHCESGQGYLFSRPVDAKVAGSQIQKLADGQAGGGYLEDLSQMDEFEQLASTYRM